MAQLPVKLFVFYDMIVIKIYDFLRIHHTDDFYMGTLI